MNILFPFTENKTEINRDTPLQRYFKRKLLKKFLNLFGLNRDAKFLNPNESLKLLNSRNTGVCITPNQRLNLEDSFEHIAIFGATGVGKTRKYVYQNIILSNYSMVVLDPKGELFHHTSGYMASRGFTIKALNFYDLSQSIRYNPLVKAGNNFAKLREIAIKLAVYGLSDSEKFWRNEAINLLYLIFIALSQVQDSVCNFDNALHLLNHVNTKEGNQFLMHVLPDEYKASYLSLIEKQEKLKSSIITTAQSCLEFINDMKIAEITNFNNLDLNFLRSGKGILYIMLPFLEQKNYSVFLGLFFENIFEYLYRTSDENPVTILIDEAGQLYIDELDKILTTIRSSKVSISLILQDYSQLRVLYGRDRAETILRGSLQTKIYFSGCDSEICNEISQKLGTIEIHDFLDDHKERRYLLEPHQIQQMDINDIILFHGNYKPIQLKIYDFTRYPQLKKCLNYRPVQFNYSYNTYNQERIKIRN